MKLNRQWNTGQVGGACDFLMWLLGADQPEELYSNLTAGSHSHFPCKKNYYLSRYFSSYEIHLQKSKSIVKEWVLRFDSSNRDGSHITSLYDLVPEYHLVYNLRVQTHNMVLMNCNEITSYIPFSSVVGYEHHKQLLGVPVKQAVEV